MKMISPDNFLIIVISWMGIAIIVFPFLLKITAPYGRHSKTNWGIMINNRSGWLIMELPALLVFSYFLVKSGNFQNKIVIIALILWVMHYFNRALIFPFRIKTKGKKMPVIIMVFALIFNFMNASLNGYWLGYMALENANTRILSIRLISGVVLFMAGFCINQYHDRLLIKLRKSSKNGYKIPYGKFIPKPYIPA